MYPINILAMWFPIFFFCLKITKSIVKFSGNFDLSLNQEKIKIFFDEGKNQLLLHF